jgi:hypothetical protein
LLVQETASKNMLLEAVMFQSPINNIDFKG